MDLILDGFWQALALIFSLDEEIASVTLLTLKVTLCSTAISTLLGVATGIFLALKRFRGRSIIIALVNTSMGLPPVVVGLMITIMLWRNGPLGALGLLYTPTAIVIAQTIIATPIIAGVTIAAIQNLPKELPIQIKALGANRLQFIWILAKEARIPLLAAVMAGFGGVISEVGASMMVGGNIKGYSRVLTTATVMETGKGNFETAIALSIILLMIAGAVNFALTTIQQKKGGNDR